MNQKQFQQYLDRDGYCLHCGETEALSPNHRAGRGMGGSKLLDRPANVIVLCSEMNNLIETTISAAKWAHENGWKIYRWEIPEQKPVYDLVQGKWFLLDNDFNRVEWTDSEKHSSITT